MPGHPRLDGEHTDTRENGLSRLTHQRALARADSDQQKCLMVSEYPEAIPTENDYAVDMLRLVPSETADAGLLTAASGLLGRLPMESGGRHHGYAGEHQAGMDPYTGAAAFWMVFQNPALLCLPVADVLDQTAVVAGVEAGECVVCGISIQIFTMLPAIVSHDNAP